MSENIQGGYVLDNPYVPYKSWNFRIPFTKYKFYILLTYKLF